MTGSISNARQTIYVGDKTIEPVKTRKIILRLLDHRLGIAGGFGQAEQRFA